jgi:hypothetical protein
MSSLFSGPGCFFVAILAFIVLGFQRGWRREVISLVFVLLASVLIHPETSDAIGAFLGRIPAVFAFLTGTTVSPGSTQSLSLLGGPVWSLVIFAGLVVLGYVVGNRVFGKPATPQERFIGIVPGVLSGAFILWFLSNYIQTVTHQAVAPVNVTDVDPGKYVPAIFVIAILALVVALIAGRIKKAQAAAGKK